MKAEIVDEAEVFFADVGHQVLPPRKAIAITAVVLLGFFVIDGSYVWFEQPPLWELVGALLGFAAILGLQLGHSFPSLAPWFSRYRYVTWGLQGLLAYLPILRFGVAWGGMAVFFTASAVLVFPAVTGWSLFCLGAFAQSLVFYHFRTGWNSAAYAAVESVLIPLIVIGLSRMSDMIVKLHRSREELSRLAVAGERLRFARDLHDVLGFSLSAISLKCELAYRLLADAPAKAHEELGDVLSTSRKALADVRSVSRGYREMSLFGEANAAVSMLSAAGIRTQLKIESTGLPAAADTVLAAVLREGLTNMLRHSKAEQCEIRAELRGRTAVLILANDGAGRAKHPKGAADGGLAALGSRVEEIGGTLAHGCDGQGWFRLEAVVPLPDRAAHALKAGPPSARQFSDAERPVRESRGLGHADMVPRAASAIALSVLVGYFLAYSMVALSFQPTFGEGVGLELCLFAALVLQCVVSFQWRFARSVRRPRLLRYGALGPSYCFTACPSCSSAGSTWVCRALSRARHFWCCPPLPGGRPSPR